MNLLSGRSAHPEIATWKGMVFAAILSDKFRIADAKANTTDGLSVVRYSYPGACFTKYAPGPADQPNSSNLTA
jgi:hypothetical protein